MAVGTVAAAAAKIAAKAAAGRAARGAAKKSGGGSMFGVLAVLATLVIMIVTVPVMLIGIAIMSVVGAGVTLDADDPDTNNPGSNLQGTAAPIPTCATLRSVNEVDGTTTNATWTSEQLENARTVIEVAMTLSWAQMSNLSAAPDTWPTVDSPLTTDKGKPDVPSQALEVAFVTAMQESSLRNLDHDDDAINPDGSVADGGGLFQQQVSQGWGTWEQVTDPAWATSRFLYALQRVDGWDEMDLWGAAHAVQGNLNATDYKKWVDGGDAAALISRFLDTSKCAALPLDGPYSITSGYGPRNTGIPGASTWHPALDFANGCSMPIYAVRGGTVTMVGGGAANNLGITDPDTGAELQYLHMEPGTEIVAMGETVQAGQQIGVTGNYGVGSGCHLDLRIYAPRVLLSPSITDDLEHTQDITDQALADYVNPNDYMALFGAALCPEDACTNLAG